MAEKLAIYVGEPIAAAIAGHESSRSARINQIAADWLEFIRASTPAFSAGQWLAIIDALNGVYLDDPATLRYCWQDIEEAGGLATKWGIDQPELANAVRRLSPPQLLALREIINRYWAAQADAPSSDAALAAAGARLTDAAAD